MYGIKGVDLGKTCEGHWNLQRGQLYNHSLKSPPYIDLYNYN